MFDNPKDELYRLEQQLKELEAVVDPEDTLLEEYEEEDSFGPGINPALDFHRTMYADEEEVFAVPSERKRRIRKAEKKEKLSTKKKKHPFLSLFVMVFEVTLIVVLLRWWLQWLT
jgi:hypothetical protein